MSVERSKEIPICPYWRRYFMVGESILALCGSESPEEPPLPGGEGLRLSQCPFSLEKGSTLAFERPAILEISPDPEFRLSRDYFRKRFEEEEGDLIYFNFAYSKRRYIIVSDKEGSIGIAQLERVWPQEVEKFIERHSK